jgi:hypothetical protein
MSSFTPRKSALSRSDQRPMKVVRTHYLNRHRKTNIRQKRLSVLMLQRAGDNRPVEEPPRRIDLPLDANTSGNQVIVQEQMRPGLQRDWRARRIVERPQAVFDCLCRSHLVFAGAESQHAALKVGRRPMLHKGCCIVIDPHCAENVGVAFACGLADLTFRPESGSPRLPASEPLDGNGWTATISLTAG